MNLRKINNGILALSLGLTACYDYNSYENMTLEEVKEAVTNFSEGQRFIDYNTDYANEDVDEDLNNSDRPKIAPNYASTLSFRTFFNRKRGICRDGAVAMLAMLQDNGYPSLYFSMKTKWGLGHSIAIYQENGLWGSGGINHSDLMKPQFNNLEEIAEFFAQKSNNESVGYTLYNLSLIDLTEGTNDGQVSVHPFIIKKVNDEETVENIFMAKHDNGYEIHNKTENIDRTIITKNNWYTLDLYEEKWIKWIEKDNKIEKIKGKVIERTSFRSPSIIENEIIKDEEIIDQHIKLAYNEDKKISQKVIRNYKKGTLKIYRIHDYEYYPKGMLFSEEQRVSNDGNYDIDHKFRWEFDEEGNIIAKFVDADNDDEWDKN